VAQEPQALQDLRARIAEAGGRWHAAETPIAALSLAEKRRRLGAEPPPGEVQLEEREQRAKARLARRAPAEEARVPASWDWRQAEDGNYITDIRDQGSCGSCVAFGTIAAIEGSLRIKARKPALAVDLSEAHLFYCHGANAGRNCGNGWWPDQALDAFKTIGVVDEACFPYRAGDQACAPCSDWRNRAGKITGWQTLTSIDQMKSWLVETGPLVSCFIVYDDFMSYGGGIYHYVSGPRLGGHCICVVGYNDSDGSWIAKNSWGPDWGESGFFRIRYGEVGIDYEMWGVEVLTPTDTSDTTELTQRKITGIWIIDQGQNAAAFIDGVGWKKIPSTDVAVFQAMLGALASAKAAGSLCNLRLEGEYIKELYVF
jgi:C1A family cysteine protease